MAEQRLIDANALIAEMHNIILEDGEDRRIIYEVIERQPTIEERKKGKWIEQDDGWDGVYYECSCCKEAFTLIDGTPSENLYNYCPNCGAKMMPELIIPEIIINSVLGEDD